MNLVEYLMARKKPVRQTIDDALNRAQNERTQARLKWIDLMVDSLIAVFPERVADFERMRADLHTGNEEYVDALNNADRALINRVTAIVLNHQLDEEERQA